MITTFRKTFHMIGREHPWTWVLVVAFAVVASGLEIVGALLVFLLLGLVADPGGSLELPVVGDIRGSFAGVDDSTFLLVVMAALAVAFVVRAVGQVGFAYTKHRVAATAAARLAARLMVGYLRLPYAFHLRRSSAELVRNTSQTLDDLARQCFLQLIYVFADVVVVVGLLVVMFVVAPWATLVAVLVVGAAALVLLTIVQPRLKRLGRTAQEMRRRTLSVAQQTLHGVRDIKVLGAEVAFGRTYRRDRGELARTLYLRGAISEVPRHVIELALMGFILAMLAVAVLSGSTSDALLSTLGLFAYAGMRIQPSLQRIVAGLNNIRFSTPAVDNLYDDLRLVELAEADHDDAGQLSFEREIQVLDVGFAYEQADRPALHGVDLTIRRGEVLGVCGPTGGGKTTLVDVITGLLEPTAGAVRVDGVDIHLARRAWFAKLGVVPQMVFLIDDTLRANIALGVRDDEVDEAALLQAVHLAQLDGFVASLPDGLDTPVGERGVRVSGGQRQRVAIARALYRRPEVVVFDEGTSALDNTTEAVLMSSLERLRGAHTIILVAHRLSTVRNCDRIVYLEDGRVQGIGGFEELRASCPGFRALADQG